MYELTNQFLQAVAETPTKKRGAPKGTVPVNAAFGGTTKLVRIPLDWNRDELAQRLEGIHSILYHAEAELADARTRGNGKLSNRFEHLAEFVADMREIMPRGDAYDPIKE